MALRLVFGSSVSLRTEAVYDALIERSTAHPEQNFIIVVPEQASLQVQEAIVARHPRHAISNIDVLTFNRLAYRVFEETGERTREAMDDYGKVMLLRLVTLRHQDELQVLRSGIQKIGTLTELKSVISELVQYNISPEMLSEKAEALTEHPALQKKLRDLAVIYRAFMAAVHEKRELAEERTARLAAAVSRWKGAASCTVAFEGFTGFTTPQYEVLRALLRHCPEVIVGVTAGSAELAGPAADWLAEHKDESALFHMSQAMTSALKELAVMEGQKIVEEKIGKEGAYAPEILHIEKHLYRTGKAPYSGENAAVRLLKARKRKDETAWLLHEIMKGIREDGLRPRDFAVIAGDLAGDREEIEEQFAAAGIPCFIDMQKPVAEDPLVRFLLDALRVRSSGFSFDDVFSFAKNPLVVRFVEESCVNEDSFSAFERIAEAENFARARGLRFRARYEKEWSASGRQYVKSRFPVINETKNALLGGLFAFDDRMEKAASVRDRVEAVRGLLQDYRTGEILGALAKDIFPTSELENEYSRIHETILRNLDRFEDIFEGENLEEELFREVLRTGLQSLVMGHVPPTKDRVVIGDLRRTRLAGVRCLFVIGANEGVLPADHQAGGLLTDYDREILREEDVTLSATSKEMAAEDRYYLYLLLTKPSEKLTVSYRSQGDDGSAMLPGELAGLMKGLFEGLQEEDSESAVLSELNSAESGAGLLASSMRGYLEKAREGRLREGPAEPDRALYQWLKAHPEYEEDLERIFDGLYYAYLKDREKLSKATAGKLFGDTLNGSVSFFEKYAECPYGHFLRYGLRLEERTEYEVSVADLGTVLHNSIDAVFKRTQTGTKWYELQGEERDELIREEVTKVLSETNNGIFTESFRKEAQQERIIRIVTRTMKTLAEQWKAGSYSMTKTEKDFGYDDALPELTISLSDGRELRLRGRIDRIDVSGDGNERTVKIIDYKSSQKKLDYTKVWHGVQLQLPLYLLAAVEMEEKEHPEAKVVPGGLYYYEIKDPVVTIEDSANPKTPEEVISGELRMKGVTNTDPAVAALIETALEGKVVPGLTITKKTGLLNAGANTASGAQLRRLGEFARDKARDLAEELISGDIRVEPYQYGGRTGCEYCGFKGVCGFDRSVRGYRYKELEPKKLEDIAPEEEGGTE